MRITIYIYISLYLYLYILIYLLQKWTKFIHFQYYLLGQRGKEVLYRSESLRYIQLGAIQTARYDCTRVDKGVERLLVLVESKRVETGPRRLTTHMSMVLISYHIRISIWTEMGRETKGILLMDEEMERDGLSDWLIDRLMWFGTSWCPISSVTIVYIKGLLHDWMEKSTWWSPWAHVLPM